MLNQFLIVKKSLVSQTYFSSEPLSSSKALPRISPKTEPEDFDPYFSNKLCSLKFLTAHKQVSWVRHPSLPEHPQYKLAKKMLPRGAGSIITFGIKGGRDAGRKFIEAVSLSSHLANVGDAKTLVIHPASTTHSHIDANAMKSAGLTDDMIRLSVGLEDISDIVLDFEQGLKAASKL